MDVWKTWTDRVEAGDLFVPNVTVDCVKPCRLFGNSVERYKMAAGEIVKS